MGDALMKNDDPKIFDVVKIVDTEESRSLGLKGAEAVILGISEGEATKDKWFALRLGPDLPTVMISSSSVERTGRSVSRDSIYPGNTIRVSRTGEVLRDTQDGR
ncbi:hypothetical protein [Cellulomonas xiejunii]|uniref:hypothetical protein n=1 Tax=Cellulomonas xiejunii TaxID=2968083 RepID=UPI001D0E0D29|nr:hypothetical protein [Cellulomonas xiejunii]MCC2314245.1 hypothetical protein [Cellulomonas xiejunii]